MSRVIPCVVLASVFVWLCSCHAAAKRGELAETAVAEFHGRLDSEQYHMIYLAADDGFRTNTSEGDFAILMGTIHKKLGRIRESRLRYYVDSQVTGVSGTVVTSVYDTTFEKDK